MLFLCHGHLSHHFFKFILKLVISFVYLFSVGADNVMQSIDLIFLTG